MSNIISDFLNNLGFSLMDFIFLIITVFLSLSIHECAHAYTAYKLGDPTAKNQGRLTLNPIKHIDILGLIAFVFLRFGWAKPVPVQALYFKNPRKGMAIVAAAGPISNILLAIIGIFLYCTFNVMLILKVFDYEIAIYFLQFFALFSQINITLAIFNLLPIAPLDGGRIIDPLLPQRASAFLHRNEQLIGIVLFIILFSTRIASRIIIPIQSGVFSALFYVISIPFTLFLNI